MEGKNYLASFPGFFDADFEIALIAVFVDVLPVKEERRANK